MSNDDADEFEIAITGRSSGVPLHGRAAANERAVDEATIKGLNLYDRAREFLKLYPNADHNRMIEVHMARFAAQMLRERGQALLDAVKGGAHEEM